MNHHPAAPPKPKTSVNDLMSRALDWHQSGALDKAEKLYKKVLKADPGNADALLLSGVVAHQLGRHPRAIQLIKKAIHRDGNQVAFHTNLAAIHNALGRWQDAEQTSRAALEIDENHVDALNTLGQALWHQGQLDEAIAVHTAAINLDPGNLNARTNLASLQAQIGRNEEAVESLKLVLKQDPKGLLAMTNLATLLTSMGRLPEAEAYCRQALEIDQNCAKAVHCLGVIQSTRGELKSAAGTFKHAYALSGDVGETLLNLASVHAALGEFEDAIRLFQEILKSDPNSAKAYFNLGVCYSEKGDMDEALSCFRAAIEIDPRNVEAYYALGTTGKEILNTNFLQNLLLLADDPAISIEERVKVNFALAAQSERQGAVGPAFSFYLRGNGLRREFLASRGRVYDPVEHRQKVSQIKELFTEEFFEERSELGDESDQPVFIVGMPRSGTTLVEKIAASHHAVVGTGERDAVPRFADNFGRNEDREESYPASIAGLTAGLAAEFAETYLAGGLGLEPQASRIVDKMPANFMYLGVIALLFPSARVIHCRRDPLDTGLSCYFQNFVHAHPWSCDLHLIGEFYRCYDQMMAHWKSVLPLPILDVQYEDVVADQEKASREIIDFLGLDWDPNCLDFHKTKSTVRTASKWQVRQPIYNKSVGRWRNYAAYLAPLIQSLEIDPAQLPLRRDT